MKKIILALIFIMFLASGVFCQSTGPMDLVVLLDTSASMSNSYRETSDYLIGPFLREFLRLGDTIHLISFAGTPKVEISRRIEAAGDIEAVIGRLLLMYPLDPQSDLSGALSFTESYSSSLPDSRTKKIVLISDGDIPGTENLVSASAGRFKSRGADLQYIKVPVSGNGPSSGRPAPRRAQAAAQTAAAPAAAASSAQAQPAAAKAAQTQPAAAAAQAQSSAAAAAEAPAAAASASGSQTQAPGAASAAQPQPAGAPDSGAQAAQAAAGSGAQAQSSQTNSPSSGSQAGSAQDSQAQSSQQADTGPAAAAAAQTQPASPSAPPAGQTSPSSAQVPEQKPPAPDSGQAASEKGGFFSDGIPLPLLIILGILALLLLGLIIFLAVRHLQNSPNRAMAQAAVPIDRKAEDSGMMDSYAETQRKQARPPLEYPKPQRKPMPKDKFYAGSIYESGNGGPVMLNLFVEDQNTAIGRRNIHAVKSGYTFTVGGGKSDFLVFLVPMPPHIADLVLDGTGCTFVPRKPEYFPDIGSHPVHDCIGKTIRVVSDKNYELHLRIERYEDPLTALNKLLHSISVPG